MELMNLRKLKENVERIVDMIPEGKVKNLLLSALRGKDVPTMMRQRESTKDRGIAI